MKKILTEWRKFLKEGQEFVEEKSPLRYDRASNVKRLALRDDSIEPPYSQDFGQLWHQIKNVQCTRPQQDVNVTSVP